MNDDERNRMAVWRTAVLGPLVSACLEHGERGELFAAAAARTQQRPDGRRLQLSARTIEAWYYAYRRGGLEALRPQVRRDRGHSRTIEAAVAALLVRAKQERPRRSLRRLIRLMERAGVVDRGQLSRSAVHRLLQAQGLSGQPRRGPAAERRSFIAAHAGDLWVGDVLHGPLVVTAHGSPRKSYLITLLDNATRFVVHSYFALSEGAVEHEHALKQALLKHGRPRTYYVDLGGAYTADSLAQIAAELGIYLRHTEARDCEAKGVIERWHRTWRDEVGDELNEAPLPLADLNSLHWAWLASEYHRRRHDTTGRAPLDHWLDEAKHLRPLPPGKDLDQVFLHRLQRKVRKDGTVRFVGRFYEVSPELVGQTVQLRFDPHDPHATPPKVFRDDRFLADTVPLDRLANNFRRRHRPTGAPAPTAVPSGLDPLALIQQEHYQRTHLPGLDHTPAAET